MIKGCQKEMVIFETGKSDLFESAYFILRPDSDGAPHDDLLSEANRIIASGSAYFSRRKTRSGKWKYFFLGTLSGFAALLACHFLFGI